MDDAVRNLVGDSSFRGSLDGGLGRKGADARRSDQWDQRRHGSRQRQRGRRRCGRNRATRGQDPGNRKSRHHASGGRLECRQYRQEPDHRLGSYGKRRCLGRNGAIVRGVSGQRNDLRDRQSARIVQPRRDRFRAGAEVIRSRIALCSWLVSAISALAQTTPAAPASTPEGGMSTKSLTVPGNGGVAGTGLGGSNPPSVGSGPGGGSRSSGSGVPGTGMSVKGPAGQGIGGQGTSTGNGLSGTDPSGSGTGPGATPAP